MIQEDSFIKLALEYKQKYNETKWWKFKKRRYYKSMWKSGIECQVRYS
jgi:hypothetical protein